MRRSLVLLLLATAIIPPDARAGGTFTDTCHPVPVAFAGANAAPGVCILGFPAVGIIPGTATPTVENAVGGLDFFHMGIGMVYDTSIFDQLQAGAYSVSVDVPVTWDPNAPAMVPTFLGLTGSVQIPDPTASITITVTGLLGGAIQGLTTTLDHQNCAQCRLNGANFGLQLQAADAIETLTITSVGRVVYRTNSPEFDGAVPEPGTWIPALLCLAGIAIKWHGRSGAPDSTQ